MRPDKLLLATGVVLLLLAVACSSDAAPEPTPVPPAATLRSDGIAVLRLVSAAGVRVSLEAEVADDVEERTQGLSMRVSLPPERGMLFVIDRLGPGFWMKDTTIPLSVAFIAPCGQIVHIAHMEPLSLQIHGTPLDYRFGLEVNQGWFERKGIAIGDKVELPPELRPATCV